MIMINECPIPALTPTFYEFVLAILDMGLTDQHWRPYSETCSVCRLTYDYIIKFESLAQEVRINS